MTNENELFGELRSVVQAEAASWERLVETINQWPDLERFEAEALPYLDEAMAHETWAAQDRVAPASWAAADHPALTLANGLNMEGSGLSAAQQLALIIAPRKHALRSIWLHNTSPDLALFSAIAASDQLAQLHTLSLHGCDGVDEAMIDALAGASALTSLRVLDLSSLKLDVNALYTLTHSPLPVQLEELLIEGNQADNRDDVFSVFYELMEKLDKQMSMRIKKGTDVAQRAAIEERKERARALYGMLETQLVDWAIELNMDEGHPRDFESFYDLME